MSIGGERAAAGEDFGRAGKKGENIFFELKNWSLEEEGGEVQLAVFWRSSQVVVLTAPALAPKSGFRNEEEDGLRSLKAPMEISPEQSENVEAT